MCQANITSLLAKSAEGDLTYENNAYYREIHGAKTGDLTLIYRVNEARANYIDAEAQGLLKDSFGREIFFIEGIVAKGLQSLFSLSIEYLDSIHDDLINDYREFWEWVSPQPAIASESQRLSECNENEENHTTLKFIEFQPYILGDKNISPIKSDTSNLVAKVSSIVNNQTQFRDIITLDCDAEVNQCLFLHDSKIVAYIRPSRVPHDHKVVIFEINLESFQLEKQRDLIQGKSGERSIEKICLSNDKSAVVSSNRNILGKDENSWFGIPMSIRSCFLKSFNFFDESETLIYEGGGELIAVSKDFKWVINATDNTLNPTLFDIKGGGKTSISSGGHKKKITCLSSSFYDNVFASGDESGFLRLWNCDTLDSIGGLEVFDSSSIDAIVFNPCEKNLVCSGNKGEIKVVEYKNDEVNSESGTRVGTHKNNGQIVKVNDLAFNPNGKTFASAGDDGSIRVWGISKDTDQDGKLLTGHDSSVMSLSFSPNGKLLASGSKDKTIKIWQID
jgi:WD40 repeat protein